MTQPISCKSEEGITIGLADAMIAVARVLAVRLQHLDETADIQQALMDLAGDEDVSYIMMQGLELRSIERRNSGKR